MASTAKQKVDDPAASPSTPVGDVHRVGRADHDEHGEDDPPDLPEVDAEHVVRG